MRIYNKEDFYRYSCVKQSDYDDDGEYFQQAGMEQDDNGNYVPYDEVVEMISGYEYELRAQEENHKDEMAHLVEHFSSRIDQLVSFVGAVTKAKEDWERIAKVYMGVKDD